MWLWFYRISNESFSVVLAISFKKSFCFVLNSFEFFLTPAPPKIFMLGLAFRKIQEVTPEIAMTKQLEVRHFTRFLQLEKLLRVTVRCLFLCRGRRGLADAW